MPDFVKKISKNRFFYLLAYFVNIKNKLFRKTEL